MKKYTLYFCLFFISFAGIAGLPTWQGDTWANTSKNGKGTITLAYTESPTFVYKDKGGKLTGVCVDIMENFKIYIEKKYKVKLTLKYQAYPHDDFDAFFKRIKNSSHGVFGLINATITPERQKEVKFSPPFLNNISIIMTGKSANTLTSLKNIQKEFGKYTAYTNVGTSNERRLLKIKKMYFPKMKIVYVPYNEDIIAKIISDKKAFTCLDFNYYTDCKQKNIPLKRHPAGDDYSESLGMLMPMNSDWDVVMKEYFKHNGGFTNTKEYKQILTRHLGTEAASLLLNKK